MTKLKFETEEDDTPPRESTHLLVSSSRASDDKREMFQSFRRKSVVRLSHASRSRLSGSDVESGRGIRDLGIEGDLPEAHPVEGLAPLFPNGGIREYEGREYVPYRDATLVKSVSTFTKVYCILRDEQII